MKVDLVPVQVGNGLVILHTPDEWLRLVRGVDLKAAEQMRAPLETNPKEND